MRISSENQGAAGGSPELGEGLYPCLGLASLLPLRHRSFSPLPFPLPLSLSGWEQSADLPGGGGFSRAMFGILCGC